MGPGFLMYSQLKQREQLNLCRPGFRPLPALMMTMISLFTTIAIDVLFYNSAEGNGYISPPLISLLSSPYTPKCTLFYERDEKQKYRYECPSDCDFAFEYHEHKVYFEVGLW